MRKLDIVGEFLLDAAFVLKVRGHCKGKQHDIDGSFCVFGSLYAVIDVDIDMEVFAKRLGFPSVKHCIRWQNDPKVKASEIIRRMEKSAHESPVMSYV